MNYKTIITVFCIFFSTLISAQEIVDVKTDIYEITYSQTYQQPLIVKYTIPVKQYLIKDSILT